MLERIERRVLVERQMAVQVITAGADVEVPDLQEAWDEFAAALTESTKVELVDQDEDDILRALGLRQ